MAVTLQGYYDGSGSAGTSVALAGYAATHSVWSTFEVEWWRVLADDTNRPACRYLHMREANALRGEFSRERGWTRDAVDSLLRDLFNGCFSPYGLHRDVPDALVGAACWVDLKAYERVCQQHPHFQGKDACSLVRRSCGGNRPKTAGPWERTHQMVGASQSAAINRVVLRSRRILSAPDSSRLGG